MRTTIAVGFAVYIYILRNVPYLVVASGHEPPSYTDGLFH